MKPTNIQTSDWILNLITQTHTMKKDGDFLLIQEEMNDWLPQDTATMYKNLVKQMKKKKKQVWGRNIFNNKNLSFEPNMNMALPANYRLGPGRCCIYRYFMGASQKSYETTVAPDGIVTLDGFGPIQVSGLTVKQANERIRAKLGKRYSNSKIRLSVGQPHHNGDVVGEVKAPGTYTLSAFTTVFNALYMAGGITDLGTLRNIKVYRQGRLISTVDVYDF